MPRGNEFRISRYISYGMADTGMYRLFPNGHRHYLKIMLKKLRQGIGIIEAGQLDSLNLPRRLSGMPAGLYTDSSLGDVEVTEDQRLVIAGQRQLNAGAYRPLKYGVEFLMKRLQLPMRDAFRLASLNPLGLMNPKLPETELLKTFVVVDVNRQNSIEVVLSVIDNQVVFQAA